MKTVLTDRALKALKPAAPGKRPIIWDGNVPSFGVRVTDKGVKTFIVKRRLGEGGQLITVNLGHYPALTLGIARDKAREAPPDIAKGEHPREKAEAERRENERRRRNSFEAVAEFFIVDHVAKLRSHKAVEAAIRADLISRWGRRPITSITRSDVIQVVREVIKRRGPTGCWPMFQNFGIGRSPKIFTDSNTPPLIT